MLLCPDYLHPCCCAIFVTLVSVLAVVLPYGTCCTYGIPQGLAAYVASLIDRTLDWNDIKWLRTICGSMKVLLSESFLETDAREHHAQIETWMV